VRSARYAGEDATYADNVAKLLRELDGVSDRRAHFRTAAVASFPDGGEIDISGSVAGVIATEPRGDRGFGYDAVFIPDEGDGRTFAEMTADEKHALSHRGRAFRGLSALLVDRPPPHVGGEADLPALFYDEGCRFCRASAALVARTDKGGRLAVLPFSDPDADRRLGSLTPEERGASMHVVRRDGSVVSAGAALTELLRGTPGARHLARRAQRSPSLQRVIDRLYRAIADNRSRLGRLVPDVDPVIRRGRRA
jgi:predicted DCC family thiol-disulfide oxidoreductase YuxK